MDEPKDIGQLLEVPEDERRDVDPTPQYNADAGFDIEVVPDGEYVELSTVGQDEELDEAFDDAGDGSPQAFIAPEDPDFEDLSEDDA